MTRVLAHRGPDEEGCFSSQSVSLGHRRLRIIDLETGQQPMKSADGRYTVVFNGEIYNFLELRQMMEEGIEFRSRCDTEVILAAYARWGISSISQLHGMFAFALWDAENDELILARDRLGKKPLFYFYDGESLVFGSEIKAILEALDSTPEIDYDALNDYLTYLYIPYPKTIFRKIRQVPPATWMRIKVRPDGLAIESHEYWSPLGASRVSSQSRRAAASDFQDSIADAVRCRMMADVPLGVLLSGGMDSSTITAMMARSSAEPVRSFSIGFPQFAAYDEIPFAKRVAQQFGGEHEVLEADARCSHDLAKIVWHFDQPFGNPTAVLTYILSALMKKYVAVALAGDGGDELFGGYPRYIGAYMSSVPRALPAFLRNGLLPRIGNVVSDNTNGQHQARRLREFLEGCGMPLIEMYLRWIGYFSPEEKAVLYTTEFKARTVGHHPGDFLRNLYAESEGLESLNRLAYVDVKSFLCCNVLEYADRMSMAHAVELRTPFTDHRLVELSLRTPFNQKFRYGESKWILKQAMKSVLPTEILNRRKLGFNPPVSFWLKGELSSLPAHLLSPDRVRSRGLFRPEAIRNMLELQASGRRDFSLKIWALMILEIWFRIYVDGLSVDVVQEEIDRAVALPLLASVLVN